MVTFVNPKTKNLPEKLFQAGFFWGLK